MIFAETDLDTCLLLVVFVPKSLEHHLDNDALTQPVVLAIRPLFLLLFHLKKHNNKIKNFNWKYIYHRQSLKSNMKNICKRRRIFLHLSKVPTKKMRKRIIIIIYCWLIARSTAQGHLRAFHKLKFRTQVEYNTKHAHYIHIKHTNIIRKVVPSVSLS